MYITSKRVDCKKDIQIISFLPYLFSDIMQSMRVVSRCSVCVCAIFFFFCRRFTAKKINNTRYNPLSHCLLCHSLLSLCVCVPFFFAGDSRQKKIIILTPSIFNPQYLMRGTVGPLLLYIPSYR